MVGRQSEISECCMGIFRQAEAENAGRQLVRKEAHSNRDKELYLYLRV